MYVLTIANEIRPICKQRKKGKLFVVPTVPFSPKCPCVYYSFIILFRNVVKETD